MQGRLSLRERLLVVLAAALLPLAVAIAWMGARESNDAIELAQVFGGLAVLLVSALLSVWWIGGRLIVKPAKQILGAVRRLERGGLDARVPVFGSGRGEFARIAAAFNLMAESLQMRQVDLEAELGRSRGAYAVLDQVLNSMQEGVMAVSTDGRFLMYNESAARMFPMKDVPVLPALWPEHFGVYRADGTMPKPEELPLVLAALGHSGGGHITFVRNELVPEGRVLQCSWQPLQGGSAQGGLVVFTDVTELHKLQSEQAAQFERIAETQRKLVESQRIGRVGNWELDLKTGRLWWSDEVLALFGMARDDFDGTLQGFEQQVHPDDRPLLKPARDRALRDAQVMEIEYRVIKPDGAVAWIYEVAEARRDERGEPVWFGGMMQDITQRKQQAIENAQLLAQVQELNASLESRIIERTEQLARQEQLYRTLTEQAPEVVWNTDRAGRVTYFNQAWYELVGGEPDNWLGDGWVALVHPDDVVEMRRTWKTARDSTTPYTGTRRILARDGTYHTMSYKGAPVVDPNGEVTSWVGIDADITQFKAIEGALRGSNQELEAFSYSVSHDLRAPLGAIAGFSKALEGKVESMGDDKAKHYLARIHAGVGKMEQLIDSMLQLSRVVRAPLEWGTVDLGAIANDTLEGLRMQAPARQVRATVDDNLLTQGDARLLRLVIENLVGNAWKFTARTDDARIHVGRDGDDSFFVRDNGVGFDMAYAGKLFTAFQRLHTEAEFPGTGVGLATVRRIIARHEGRVWVESEPGCGTTFRFSLPRATQPAWYS